MKKNFKKIFYDIGIGVFVSLFPTFITSVILTFNNYGFNINLFFLNKLIETYYTYALFLSIIFIICLIIMVFIKKRMLKGYNINLEHAYFGEDYTKLSYFNFHNLVWEITTNNVFSDDLNFFVEDTPLCPNQIEGFNQACLTPLNFDKHFLWYTWSCPSCGYKYRTLEYRWFTHENVKKNLDGWINRLEIRTNSSLKKFLNKIFKV